MIQEIQQTNNRRDWIRKVSALCAGLLLLPRNGLQAQSAAVLPGFTTEPFLQNMYTGSVTLTWIAAQNSFSWVVYGTSETNLSGKVIPRKDGQAMANRQINRVQIKRLFPGRKYYYQVVSKVIIKLAAYNKQYGVEYKSRVYSFTVPDLDREKVSTLIVNDTEAFADQIKKIFPLVGNVDFVHLNGNIVRTLETEQNLIDQVIKPAAETFATQLPFSYTRGVHEMRGAWAGKFYDYIETPGGQAYFSLRWGPVFFLFLDSGENDPDSQDTYYGLSFFDEYRLEQQQWLTEQLQSAEAQTARYRVACMSFPTYHGTDEHGLLHCRQLFSPLFDQYRLDALVAGYAGNEQIYLPERGKHDYAIVVGGISSKAKFGFILLDADQNRLRIALVDQNGTEKACYDSSLHSSVGKLQAKGFDLFTDDKTLWIRGEIDEPIQVYDTHGRMYRLAKASGSNLWQVCGLIQGGVYFVRVGESTQKILF